MLVTPPFRRQRQEGGHKFMASKSIKWVLGSPGVHVQKGREKSTIKPGTNSFVLEFEQAKEILRMKNISCGFGTVSRTCELVPREKGTSNTASWIRLVRGSVQSTDVRVEEAHYNRVIQRSWNRILQHCRERSFSFGVCEITKEKHVLRILTCREEQGFMVF